MINRHAARTPENREPTAFPPILSQLLEHTARKVSVAPSKSSRTACRMTRRPTVNKSTNNIVCNDNGVDRSSSRRAFERVACATTAKAFEITADDTVLPGCPAIVHDISKSGVGLRTRKMYNVGTRVALLIAAKENQTRPYFGIVRQSRYAGKAMYAVGIEFTPALQSESVIRWMIQDCIGS